MTKVLVDPGELRGAATRCASAARALETASTELTICPPEMPADLKGRATQTISKARKDLAQQERYLTAEASGLRRRAQLAVLADRGGMLVPLLMTLATGGSGGPSIGAVFHLPKPPDIYHRKYTPEGAERMLDRYEKEHHTILSAQDRLLYAGAMRQGEWHRVMRRPNPIAREMLPIVATSGIPGGAGGRAALPFLERLVGRVAPKAVNEGAEGGASRVVGALTREQNEGLRAATRPNSVRHVFGKAQHDLGAVTQKLGSEEAVLREAVLAVPRGQVGRFEVTARIGGYDVVVRGRVVQGIPRIGTMFRP